jgi:hypothetical protein
MTAPRVGIIGIGQSPFTRRRDDASYPDLVREAVIGAMRQPCIRCHRTLWLELETPKP